MTGTNVPGGSTAADEDVVPRPAPAETDDDRPAAQPASATGQDAAGEGTAGEGTAGEETGTTRLRRALGSRPRRIAAVLLAVLLVAAAVGVARGQLGGLPVDAAFAVGDEVVTEAELDERMQTLRALYGVEPPADPAGLDRFRRDAAKSVAVSTILDHETAAAGIVVAEKRTRDAMDRYIEQQFGAAGRDGFIQALGVVGTTERAVLDEISRQLALSDLMDRVIGTVEIGEADVRAAFEQRRAELGTPERRELRHIVVGSAAEADAVLAELVTGRPFEDLAAQRSLDAATRDSGGALGRLARAQLAPAFGDAAFTTAVGVPFGPVTTDRGVYIGRVDAILPPVPAELPQVAEGLRETLRNEVALQRWRDWLAERIRDADVEYAEQYRPADPGDPGVSVSPGGPPPPPR